MLKHLGLNIREKSGGLKLTRENYIKVGSKSSFGSGLPFTEQFIKRHTKDCLRNFDLNMQNFSSLSKKEFNDELTRFLDKTKVFQEVTDLSLLNASPGYYIMVLDEYSQAYIGRSGDITRRIRTHWTKHTQFDRLIFGEVDNSILSIDSFRAYDTTRIFVYVTDDLEGFENDFINSIDDKYLLNRTIGGTLDGLFEAMLHGKTRKL